MKLDLKAERMTITHQSMALQVRKAEALDRAIRKSEQPGGSRLKCSGKSKRTSSSCDWREELNGVYLGTVLGDALPHAKVPGARRGLAAET